MILEIMQSDYLARSTNVLAENLRGVMADFVKNDRSLAELLQKEGIEYDDLKLALEQTTTAANFLKKPSEEEATAFPRDAASSQVQSILQRYFLDHQLVRTGPAAGAGEIVQPISDISLVPAVSAPAAKKLFGTMSQSDVRWIACLAAQAYRKFAKRRPFPDKPAEPCTIANDARIYLLGDWGSGVARAKKITDRIKTMLNETTREQHVIHLGDVYYSGWPEEYDEHFLANWPVLAGEETRCGSWCLNANHDMFSGGYGYFDHLLKDERFKRQRFDRRAGASYFSLENKHWQILGLDSAWDDGDLAGSQHEWVEDRQKKNPKKNLILLTHHQPISAFEHEYSKLQALLSRNQVRAWFWGHEHRFALYRQREDLPYGRLIGHGGVPVWKRSWGSDVDQKVTYVSDRGFRSGLEEFSLFGFAVLDFAEDKIQVRYFDEYGNVERSETMEPWPNS